MVALSALGLMPALLQTPASLPVSPVQPSVPAITAERIDHLRSLLLQRELQSGPQAATPSKPAIILGQWRN
ncbi:MAG: hypothetical protein L0Y50_11990 [Beijerinckiaceae bacterium]|nr:hypothetical protein [Beijerinckiaceae bacterium]